jgi:hypothetical protein
MLNNIIDCNLNNSIYLKLIHVSFLNKKNITFYISQQLSFAAVSQAAAYCHVLNVGSAHTLTIELLCPLRDKA